MESALIWLLDVLEGALNLFSSLGVDSYITSGIGAFDLVYSVCKNIATTVCQPIAYTLLTIFLLIDLYEVTMHLSQQGGGGMAAPVAGLKSIFKLAAVKWLIDSSSTFLSGIFSIAVSITSQVGGSLNDLTSSVALMRTQIDEMDIDIWTGIAMLVVIFLIILVALAAVIGVTYVVLSRYFQAYFYIALAPIPLATFAEQHASQIGLGFIRGYAGVCLQSAVVALALRLFPLFESSLGFSSADLVGSCLRLAVLMVILLGTVMGSGQLAKSVLGAG